MSQSAYQVKTRDAYFQDLLDDIANTLPGARLRGPGDDLYDVANADSAALEQMAAFLNDSRSEAFDDTAGFESLKKRNRNKIGEPLAPTPARLSIIISGTAGTIWTADHILIATASGQRYAPLAGGVMPGSGTTTITVEALVGGDAGALPSGTQLIWEAPPAGMAMIAASTGAPEGGSDAEDVEGYRARVLDYYRRPVAGGTLHDFEQWALAVSGIGYATAFRYRRAIGTVDVAVLDLEMDDVSDEVLAACQAKLNLERPALPRTVYAVKPVRTPLDVTRRLVMSPGYGFSTFTPRPIMTGSTASALVVVDLSGLAAGDWCALRLVVNGRTRFCARPVLALEDGVVKRILLDPPLPADPVQIGGVWPTLRPGCPTYDALALSVQDTFRSLRSGAPFYNSAVNSAITMNPEVLNCLIVTPADDVEAVVNAATIEHLVLGDLVLEGA